MTQGNAPDEEYIDPHGECAAEIARLSARVAELEGALKSAVKIAGEARKEWDAAPSGMRAGKLLVALSGKCPGYREDIDLIFAALSQSAHPRSQE